MSTENRVGTEDTALARLVERLSALPHLAGIPPEELEWLAAHGQLEVHPGGSVVAPKGRRVEKLWIILSGRVAVRVDRGAGPRRVMAWGRGEVSGMLPFSRMTGPPGDNYLEEPGELVSVHVKHFPEMMLRCPAFTAYTVHLMLDRARSFNTSDLHDEKMVSLGKLAAGLAHELNNPASATMRNADMLLAGLELVDAAARNLGLAGATGELFDVIERVRAACLARPAETSLSPVQRADREDQLADWLERHGADPALAAPLADTAVTLAVLDTLAQAASGATLDAALGCIAASCSAHALGLHIKRAATHIHDLVAAVKRFTYMDNLAGPELVDVASGLGDTLAVLSAKTAAKGAVISLDVEPGLPRIRATGVEINQVWINLIDNALDAIGESGRIELTARRNFDRVVISVADDGPGIPEDIMPWIFDAFYTTKPPGQGTGLGLEMTRRLVRRYHGDITAESRPGRTEFRVSFPVDG